MQALILIGARMVEKDGATVKEVVNLYTGLDGNALHEAADKAAKSGEFYEIGRITNPSCAPMPVVATETKGTVPTFPRPKEAVKAKKSLANPEHIRNQDEVERERRKQRLAPTPTGKEADESELPKTGQAHPGGSSVVLLREDGPTFEEYIAKGYQPDKYPPTGYAAKDSIGWTQFQAEAAKVEQAKANQAEADRIVAETKAKQAKDAAKTTTTQDEMKNKENPNPTGGAAASTIATVILLFASLLLGICGAKAADYDSINLPITFAAPLGNNTAFTTNLVNGWTNPVYSTNISRLWDTPSASFVTTTNITTNNVVLYADFDALQTDWIVLQSEFSSSSANSTSNEVLTVARSITKNRFDTLNNFTVTNAANGVTPSVGLYQIDMRGYKYARIVTLTFYDTNSTHFYTNNGKYFSRPKATGSSNPSGW